MTYYMLIRQLTHAPVFLRVISCVTLARFVITTVLDYPFNKIGFSSPNDDIFL
jgi:hypothetical protein